MNKIKTGLVLEENYLIQDLLNSGYDCQYNVPYSHATTVEGELTILLQLILIVKSLIFCTYRIRTL